MIRKALFVSIVGVIAVMAFAGTAFAAQFRGTVVHKNTHAHSFVVAKRSGALVSVHARRSPALGRRVRVQAHVLSNGTVRARHIDKGRMTHRVHIRGVVTFVDPAAETFVVSARGVSLAVSAADVAGELPAVGDVVTVDGSFDEEGDIDADTVENEGENQDAADLEGQVVAVDPEAMTITITADDDEDLAGATITVYIPDTWDITAFVVGDEVEIVATLNDDGTYTAVYSSLNGDAEEADDEGDDQGDDCQGDEITISGQIVAIDAEARILSILDDYSGDQVDVCVPDTWDMSYYAVDDSVQFEVTQNDDGTYSVVEDAEDSD